MDLRFEIIPDPGPIRRSYHKMHHHTDARTHRLRPLPAGTAWPANPAGRREALEQGPIHTPASHHTVRR
jgi:hypothetical protein